MKVKSNVKAGQDIVLKVTSIAQAAAAAATQVELSITESGGNGGGA